MSLSMVEWLQSIGVPVSEATQQNLDDECVDVRDIMGLNDDQLRELGFSKMGHRLARPSSRSSGVHLLSWLPLRSQACSLLAALAQAPVIVVAAVARPKTATPPAGRAAAEVEEMVKDNVLFIFFFFFFFY
jgi:hypothetical protein